MTAVPGDEFVVSVSNLNQRYRNTIALMCRLPSRRGG